MAKSTLNFCARSFDTWSRGSSVGLPPRPELPESSKSLIPEDCRPNTRPPKRVVWSCSSIDRSSADSLFPRSVAGGHKVCANTAMQV